LAKIAIIRNTDPRALVILCSSFLSKSRVDIDDDVIRELHLSLVTFLSRLNEVRPDSHPEPPLRLSPETLALDKFYGYVSDRDLRNRSYETVSAETYEEKNLKSASYVQVCEYCLFDFKKN
jgi:hypothetical protein